MNRKEYFKGMFTAIMILSSLGILSLFSMDGADLLGKILAPACCFSIVIGIVIHGYKKYR